jgi:predicted transposase YbfD/YdcC
VLDENLSVAQFVSTEDRSTLLHLPLSMAAYEEFSQLEVLLSEFSITDRADEWVYCWGGKYTTAKFYNHIHAHISVPKVYHWLWKSSCVMTTKMFAWLILKDRLNTRDLLQRRHWKVTEEVHCVLCSIHAYEDRVHLFFECISSQRVWNYLQID